MDIKFQVCTFDSVKGKIIQQIKSSTLIPVIGSGFSFGSSSKNGTVPNGSGMKNHMISSLNNLGKLYNLDSKSFSSIAKYYNQLVDKKIRKQYIINNFIGTKLSQDKVNFLKIKWPYIYTLNIDDAIEKNSSYQVVGPKKQFEENIAQYGEVVFKLHGDAKEIVFLKDGEEFSVFDIEQYISSLEQNKWILEKLRQDYLDKNILFIGCSLDDEIDLMHVAGLVKNKSLNITEKYFVTDKEPDETSCIDLKSYGITTVIKVNSYDEFYSEFYNIRKEAEYYNLNELDQFKNIPIERLAAGNSQNADYIVYEKIPYNKKYNRIFLPYFFISRNLSDQIIKNFESCPLQIVYGRRISGKSYVLIDLLNKVKDKDRYYFDSRTSISKDNIDYLFNLSNTLILIDTNVLYLEKLLYVLNYDLKRLQKNNVNIVVCANVSKKEEAIELQKTNKNPLIKLHYLENKFISGSVNSEFDQIKAKMTACNLPYFAKEKTMLDSIIEIQNNLSKRRNDALTNFNIDPDCYLHIVCLLLLAHYKKITSSDIIKFCLSNEPYELMSKLDKAVEQDYRNMITSSFGDNSYYQIVCNAQVWLLGYLSKISLRNAYFDSIVKAVVYIAGKIKESLYLHKRNNNELYEFIQFDNLNFLLGGARSKGAPSGVRKIMQNIYYDLKPICGNEYQFNHQYAKCLLWGIEELSEPTRSNDLRQALQSMLITIQIIQEGLHNNPRNEYLQISLAHAQFTLCMIRVKQFFFDKNKDTFNKAVNQLYLTLHFSENLNAYELYEDISNDEKDYSISKFMDYILDEESIPYRQNLKNEINYISSFRFKQIQAKGAIKKVI